MSKIVCPDCGAPIKVNRTSRLYENSHVDPDTGQTDFADPIVCVEDFNFTCTECRWFAYQHHLIFAVTDDNRVVPYREGMWPDPDPQND